MVEAIHDYLLPFVVDVTASCAGARSVHGEASCPTTATSKVDGQ